MLTAREAKAVRYATNIVRKKLTVEGVVFNSPTLVREYLALKLAGLQREEFHVLFLDAQHRLIADDCMFQGTLTQTSVYPREVAKAALLHNAAAVILAHNHPSGVVTASRADELLTQSLKSSLALFDVRVLDHFIVGAGITSSMAEQGLM